MPSPITTSGFQVTERPGIQYLDPRLLTPAYGNILPSIGQGAQMFEQIAGMPTRRKLQQIGLQQAQDELAQAPMRRQLQQIALAKASQPIESDDGVSIVDIPRTGGSDILQPMVDENGQPILDSNGEPRLENIVDSAPIDTMLQSRVKVFNPATGAVSYENRIIKPERTAEQKAGDVALQSYRNSLGEAQLQRANTIAGKLAVGKKISQGINPSTGTIVVTLQNPDGTLEQVDTGQAPPPTFAQQIGAVPLGLPNAEPSTVPTISGAPARFNIATPTASADQLMSELSKEFGSDGGAAITSLKNPARPKTEAEYNALGSGAFYIGQDGSVRQKK